MDRRAGTVDYTTHTTQTAAWRSRLGLSSCSFPQTKYHNILMVHALENCNTGKAIPVTGRGGP
jgi:hypothetical protein